MDDVTRLQHKAAESVCGKPDTAMSSAAAATNLTSTASLLVLYGQAPVLWAWLGLWLSLIG